MLQQFNESNIYKLDENDATFDVFAELEANTNYTFPIQFIVIAEHHQKQRSMMK